MKWVWKKLIHSSHRNVRKLTNVICPSVFPYHVTVKQCKHIGKYWVRDQRRGFETPIFWITIINASYTQDSSAN